MYSIHMERETIIHARVEGSEDVRFALHSSSSATYPKGNAPNE